VSTSFSIEDSTMGTILLSTFFQSTCRMRPTVNVFSMTLTQWPRVNADEHHSKAALSALSRCTTKSTLGQHSAMGTMTRRRRTNFADEDVVLAVSSEHQK
jgi:hypothetical protein